MVIEYRMIELISFIRNILGTGDTEMKLVSIT